MYVYYYNVLKRGCQVAGENSLEMFGGTQWRLFVEMSRKREVTMIHIMDAERGGEKVLPRSSKTAPTHFIRPRPTPALPSRVTRNGAATGARDRCDWRG